MKQTWLLSCLGSLGKRKKTVEGKLDALFSKETLHDFNDNNRRGADMSEVTEAIAASTNKVPIIEKKARITKKKKKKKKKTTRNDKKNEKSKDSKIHSIEIGMQEICANASITAQGDLTAQVTKKSK